MDLGVLQVLQEWIQGSSGDFRKGSRGTSGTSEMDPGVLDPGIPVPVWVPPDDNFPQGLQSKPQEDLLRLLLLMHHSQVSFSSSIWYDSGSTRCTSRVKTPSITSALGALGRLDAEASVPKPWSAWYRAGWGGCHLHHWMLEWCVPWLDHHWQHDSPVQSCLLSA